MAAKEIRVVLIETIKELMAKDERLVALDADLGKAIGSLALRKDFPGRAFDVGIAEANMVSIAAGMASTGLIPLIFTFTPFMTRRVVDQICISVAYAHNNVKMFGLDTGINAEINGATHMSVEDVGVLRSIPGLVIYDAADGVQLAKALPQIIAYDGPVYTRAIRKSSPEVFDPETYRFDLFKADMVKEGKDVSVFATNIMLAESLEAAKLLEAEGISAEIINVHTLKPVDEETIIKSAAKTGAVVTAENHNVVGGLASAAAETLSKSCPVPLRAIGIQDRFGQVGKVDFLKKEYQMTAADIAAAAKSSIAAKRNH